MSSAMSMARLGCKQGKPQQAHELLAPIYGWFTEGFDPLDLNETKALVPELHPLGVYPAIEVKDCAAYHIS